VRKRFKDAGITPEQIVDGTTGCDIWFFINVAERQCFMSENEESDGSVVLSISGMEDWATIPEDFYKLSGREVKGANACVFGSFLVEGKPYTLLKNITHDEVIEQGYFEQVTDCGSTKRLTEKSRYGSLESAQTPKEGQKVDPISFQDMNPAGDFPYSKRALISSLKNAWPTIERDLADASKNGLSAAKAGSRKWDMARVVNWGRANNKIVDVNRTEFALQNVWSTVGFSRSQ